MTGDQRLYLMGQRNIAVAVNQKLKGATGLEVGALFAKEIGEMTEAMMVATEETFTKEAAETPPPKFVQITTDSDGDLTCLDEDGIIWYLSDGAGGSGWRRHNMTRRPAKKTEGQS